MLSTTWGLWWFETRRGLGRVASALVASLSEPSPPARSTFSSSIGALDAALDGGLPAGRLCEIGGPPESGKSTVAWAFACAAAQTGRAVLWVDADGTFRPHSVPSPSHRLIRRASPVSLEQAVALCGCAVRSGGFSVVVIDALDALATDEAYGDHRLLPRRKRIEDAVRILHAATANTGTTMILVRHGERSVDAPLSAYASTRIVMRAPRRSGMGPRIDRRRFRARLVRSKAQPTDREVSFFRPALSGERTVEVGEQVVDIFNTDR